MLKEILEKAFLKPTKKSRNFVDLPIFGNEDIDNAKASDYKNNTIVHRCVSLIATSASHVPLHVYHKNSSGRKKIIGHKAEKLLQRPNASTSGAEFFTNNISNLLLYGNSYLLATTGDKDIRSIHNLHPNQIEIVKNYGKNNGVSNNVVGYGKICGYKYPFADSRKYFPINPINQTCQVLHLRNYNPTDNENGLSSLQAAAKSINLYSKILDWNKSLLNNSARPSGALIFQDGNGHLTEEQFERLKEQFYSNFSGSGNSGKPLILEGGLKWQDTNQAEKFEKFIELKDSSARDIAISFNVPPQLLGINGDNTYSNMQEARLALWEENIIPLLDKYSDALSNWLSHYFAEDLIIDFDRDAISVLTERRENLWAKISSADFMTINEKREFFGLPALKEGEKLQSLKEGEKLQNNQ